MVDMVGRRVICSDFYPHNIGIMVFEFGFRQRFVCKITGRILKKRE
ncbi:predicted protein [Botrytis cinerea T4]|uniref:Uncharacterized protein n=1 Tax=Botryotinia fuckeliana (strain T4) TaxID=999810 RepID=G2YXZ9_BOTF4|nr:predicted protein [Botrytis cinerea T4]